MSKKPTFEAAAEAPSRYALFVLGMHRSGTSVLGGILHHLGCTLPNTLLQASENNPKGYFESRAIQQFDDRLLEAARSHWRDWRPLRPDWFTSPNGQGYLPEAREVFRSEFGEAPLVLVKDPRICRMVPFWSQVVSLEGYTPRFVLTFRNPMEVAKSLQKRNDIETAEALLLWLRHTLEFEAKTRGQPRHVTGYEPLLENWTGALTRLQDNLGLVLPHFDEQASLQIEEFITRDLRHHEEMPGKVTENPTLSAWIRDTYEIFDRWAREGELKADYKRLDRIREAFDMASPIFGQLIAPLEKGRATLQARIEETEAGRQKLAGELDTLKTTLAEVKAEYTTQRESLERLQGEYQQQTDDLSQARAQSETELEALRSQLHGRETTASDLEARLKAAESRLSTTQEEHEQQRAAWQETKSHLEARLGDLRERLGSAEGAWRQREAQQASLEAELRDLRGRLEETRSALAQRQLEAEQQSSRAELSEQARDEANRQRDRLESQIERQYEEMGLMARTIAEAQSASHTAQTEASAEKARADRELEEENARLKAELTSERAGRSSLEEAQKKLMEQAASDARRVQVQQRELGELARLLEGRAAERAQFEAEVTALRSSTSWRLTAPLRAVVDRLRGNR